MYETPISVRPYKKPDNLQVKLDTDTEIKDSDINIFNDAIFDTDLNNRQSMSKTTFEHGMSDRSLFSSKVSSPRFIFTHTPKAQHPKRKKMPFNSVKINQIELNQKLNEKLDS